LVQAGALGLLGTGLADLLRLEAQATTGGAAAGGAERAKVGPAKAGRAKSVVFIFQSGGPSQHETFDPKPDAPDSIRGEYGTIQTAIPGVRFCEYLPKLAARAGRFAVVRTMHHIAERRFRNEHVSGTYLLHTGSTMMPVGGMDWPSIGSMLEYVKPQPPGAAMPAVVELPRTSLMRYHGRGPGILGAKYERWGVDLAPTCRAKDPAGSCPNCFSHDDPNDPARAAGPGPNAWWDNTSCRKPDFRLPDLGGVNLAWSQILDRASLRADLESLTRRLEQADRNGTLASWDQYRHQAMQLLSATKPGGSENPFDLARETDRVRDLYGREEWGQGFLVARRLVEAGVRMVQINLRGWDTHQNAFRDLKGKLLPSIDHCLSGFLDDLEERGLLDETLVVMCGEMGRTPTISPIAAGGKNASGEVFTPGRHHWGDVFPCFFAGGGVRPGQVIGQTDRVGGLPASEAYTPADLAATIFHLCGVGPETEFHDVQGRPYRITQGTPIKKLVG
jgi:hypothetical protein